MRVWGAPTRHEHPAVPLTAQGTHCTPHSMVFPQHGVPTAHCTSQHGVPTAWCSHSTLHTTAHCTPQHGVPTRWLCMYNAVTPALIPAPTPALTLANTCVTPHPAGLRRAPPTTLTAQGTPCIPHMLLLPNCTKCTHSCPHLLHLPPHPLPPLPRPSPLHPKGATYNALIKHTLNSTHMLFSPDVLKAIFSSPSPPSHACTLQS
jgi:hypothetical protein